MKSVSALALALQAGVAPAGAETLQMTPVSRVLNLLKDLKQGVETDGKKEQTGYDKFACWCEDTMERKAKDIADGKAKIEKLQNLINKLNGEIGSHSAEIEQLKKDIAQNMDAQKEAMEIRDKENAAFETEKNENEQCIGALESAIKALTGAGTKGGFLDTMRDAKLLSVAADMRRVVLRRDFIDRAGSKEDVEVIQRFIAKPDEFTTHRTGDVSAAQVGKNPFGEYAPQSTQIQGILKGMYDSFAADLEKSNAEEADKQKGFEALMATKQRELETLSSTFKAQEMDGASKTKQMADGETEQMDAKAQLKADEAFFEDTKGGCKTKARDWAERSRLRTEELVGITKAIALIDSPESRAIFGNSSSTFLQVASIDVSSDSSRRKQAYNKLKAIAAKYKSLGLAQIAAAVNAGGHFDKVIRMIDEMIALLRKEEAADVAHRDRCQNAINKNTNDMADLQARMTKLTEEIGLLGDEQRALETSIGDLETAIESTNTDLEDRLGMRSQERDAHVESLKDDDAAISIVQQAIGFLSEFYKSNKIPLSMAQRKQSPEYTVDQDKAPDATFEDGSYGGRKQESGGIISILSMIVEDIKNEMAAARRDDADAQASYEKDRQAMLDMRKAQQDSKIAAEQALAESKVKMEQRQQLHDQAGNEHGLETAMSQTLQSDCSWVDTHFDSRREKRKTEMGGLADAKAILAGANAGDYDPLSIKER